MCAISTSVIERIKDVIVLNISPKLLIIFGSQARNEADTNSDLDLLVVLDNTSQIAKNNLELNLRVSRLLAVFNIPFDLIICENTEFEHWKSSVNHPFGRAWREGKIVYERD